MNNLTQWTLVVERLKGLGHWPTMTPEELARLNSPALLRECQLLADTLEETRAALTRARSANRGFY